MPTLKKIIIPVFLFLSCLISRIIFTNKYVYHWDGIQYILGVKDFDILSHQPHPPGFFNYIFMGKIADLFLHNPEKSLNYLGIILSAISVIFFYFIVLEIFKSKEDAIWCSLLFLSSPVIWFYGEIVNSFVPEMCFLLLFVYILLKEKNNYFLFFLGGWILGIRIYLIIYVLPLLLFSFNKKAIKPNKMFLLLAAFTVGFLLWFLPTVYFTGGLKNYIFVFQKHIGFNTRRAFLNHPLEPISSFVMLIVFLFWGVGYIASFVFPLILKIKNKKYINWYGKNNFLLFTWFFCGLFFYSLTGATNPGYIIGIIPPLIIISYSIFKGVAESLELKKYIIEIILIFFILFNCYDFLVSKKAISLSEIKSHDLMLSKLIYQIKSRFNPKETAILTYPFFKLGLRHAVYYLPEYYVFEEEEIKNKVEYIPFFKGRKTTPKTLKKINNFYFPLKTKYLVFFAPALDIFELAKIYKNKIKNIKLNNNLFLYFIEI